MARDRLVEAVLRTAFEEACSAQRGRESHEDPALLPFNTTDEELEAASRSSRRPMRRVARNGICVCIFRPIESGDSTRCSRSTKQIDSLNLPATAPS